MERTLFLEKEKNRKRKLLAVIVDSKRARNMWRKFSSSSLFRLARLSRVEAIEWRFYVRNVYL